jgi:hypothetical protein
MKVFLRTNPFKRNIISVLSGKEQTNELKPRRANVFGSFFKKNKTSYNMTLHPKFGEAPKVFGDLALDGGSGRLGACGEK